MSSVDEVSVEVIRIYSTGVHTQDRLLNFFKNIYIMDCQEDVI